MEFMRSEFSQVWAAPVTDNGNNNGLIASGVTLGCLWVLQIDRKFFKSTSQAGGGVQTPAARSPEQRVHVEKVPEIILAPPAVPVQPEDGAAASEDEQRRLERFKKYDPPVFSGLASDDALGFLEECHRILRTIGISGSSGVSFTTFQLRGAAYEWWRTYELDSPDEAASLTWIQFSKLFMREFVPKSLRNVWCAEFKDLCQGIMTVSEYAIRYTRLARHAPALVFTVCKRVCRFIEGLIPSIRDASVLFDLGSTYSYVSSYFASHLGVSRDSLSFPVYVSTPVGDFLVVDHRRWLELLKDYDITILYHPGKANVVADAFSHWAESLGSLAYLPASERPMAMDIQALASQFVRLNLLDPSQVLACVVSRSSLFDRIRERQYDDSHLLVLKDKAGGGVQTPAARSPEQRVHVEKVPEIILASPAVPVQPEDGAAASEDEQRRLERFKKYDPPVFSGLASDDALGFLEECHRILRTIGISGSSGVSFTTFQLRGAAYEWWRTYELDSPDEAASLTWIQFSKLFMREFVPKSLRNVWCAEFKDLCQGIMTVSEYAIRYTRLARHAPALVFTVCKRVCRFIEGLIPSIRDASVLFDLGSTYSYVSSYFASHLGVSRDSLSFPVYVSTPVGDFLVVDHRRWLELLKDYDITILYHPGKANVVADAFSHWAESLGSLAYLPASERPMAMDIQALASQFVRLNLLDPSQVLACVVSRSSLFDRIRERQYDDSHLLVLKDKV
ncbi:uncharacterized protein [Nicotiana sylvestris]|uniref:uncharacterized protein n=1 Tax=Nicotiana sylvestris TaxID=4096 RepID=UPI00388CC9D0